MKSMKSEIKALLKYTLLLAGEYLSPKETESIIEAFKKPSR